MTYHIGIERRRRTGKPIYAILILVTALVIVLLSLVDFGILPTMQDASRPVVVSEDWHGNVRRSNWPN